MKRLKEEKEAQEVIQKLEDSLLRNRKEERDKSIAESKCNEVYKRIKTTRTPTYLIGKLKNKRHMIARFKCGNEFRGRKYWKAEADNAEKREKQQNMS